MNIALNSGTINVYGGTGVYLNPGMAALEGVTIDVTSGIGVQNSETAIAVMGNTTIHVSTSSIGVSGGMLYMNNDYGVINVDGMNGIGVNVDYLEMTGGKINANGTDTTAIYAEGDQIIKVLTGTGAYPAVTAEFYDENSGSTAMAIMAKPVTSEDGTAVYPAVILQAEEQLIFARAEAGLINADFLENNGGDFEVYSPTTSDGYWTLVLHAN